MINKNMINKEKLGRRIHDAEAFFRNPNESQEFKNKYIEEYKNLVHEYFLLNAKFYSRLVEEQFWFEENDMVFTSGVRYTPEQLAKLLDLTKPQVKRIHESCKLFSGRICVDDQIEHTKIKIEQIGLAL